ncbi:MAG: exopolyphosphatase-like protein [Frankiales bacterium]|nr:exopolyphosphatase-like protein [Frankiales bacterium]MCW2708654.1 exopolyphosphatase-like protein [Frankiales bacterium]
MTSSAWDDAVTLLREHDEVALACHVNPDGDALGSMLALGIALRDMGKQVVASWGSEPFEIPAAYEGLPGLDLLVPASQFPASPALLVTFDTGSVDRLGALADRVAAAEHVLVIDHHTTNTCFGTVNVIDRGAAATAAVVVELLDLMHRPLTAEIAAPVYTGLVTDTGSFKYAATTPSVHLLAARLLETGIPHDEISRQIWDTASFGYVKLLGLVCARAVLEADEVGGLGLVWTAIGADDLDRYALALSDVEGVIDVVRMAREAEVAVVLKTDPEDGLLKVSTRSKGAVDVGAVCASLGGGGHRFAAGFTSDAPLSETMDCLRRALAETPHLAT